MCDKKTGVRNGVFECDSGNECNGTECYYVFHPYPKMNVLEVVAVGVCSMLIIVTLLFLLVTTYGVIEWPI